MDAQPPLLLLVSTLLLLLFTAVAAVDGLYFHLYRYRLYARPASRTEHHLHTANAALFPVLTWLLFCGQPRGGLLWLAALLAGVTFAIEVWDVLIEPRSRADLGGLTGSEYAMHFLMSGVRWGGLLPLLLSAPPADWALQPTEMLSRPGWMVRVGWSMALPGVAIALLHVLLGLYPGIRIFRQPARTAL